MTGAVAGAGLAFWFSRDQIQTPISTPEIARPNDRRVSSYKPSLYGVDHQANRLQTVPLTVEAENPQQALRISLERLIAGSPELYSEVPPKTKLLDLSLSGQEIRLNLSQEFTGGGGSASMTRRLAQVLYTATSLDPQAKVFLLVEGKPLQNLGGEGVEVLQPIRREDVPSEF
ncbi:MAG: GerMN domain-containing protein [Pseudanabaenaceae cyanobacterium bins.68]|nr:GerMN domain-containing protein [Pseudanabaenaceae cyanobacterium bins.68]